MITEAGWIEIIGLILGFVLAFYKLHLQQKTNTKKILAEITKNDKKQDFKLLDVDKKLQIIEKQFIKIEKQLRKEQYLSDLQKSLNNIAFTYIKHANIENKNIISMIIDGGQKGGDFFVQIYRDGLENFDEAKVRLNALSLMKKVRSPYVEKIDAELLEVLKKENVCKSIELLIQRLKDFSSGMYNGQTPEKFKVLAESFISEILDSSIKTIHQHCQKKSGL